MRSLHAAAALSLLAALGAGAVARAQVPPAAPTMPAASSSAAPALSGVAADLPPPPAVDDPLLEAPPLAAKQVAGWQDALTLVKARSIDYRLALADLERAHAQAEVAQASSMPTLTGTANISQPLLRTITNPRTGDTLKQYVPENSHSISGSATLSIPVYAPRAWWARGTARESERAAELQIAEQKRLLAAAVADSLVAEIVAERVVELNRSALRAALERVALTKRRVDLGVATALDLLRVEQDANTTRAQVVAGDEALRKAREALGLALGFSEPYGVPRDLSLDQFARDSERACPRGESADQRTDVGVARQRGEVAKRATRDAELAYHPTVNVVTTYGITWQPFTPVLQSKPDRHVSYHTWTIAGVLSWNIYDGGARAGQLRDAEAQAGQAMLRTEQTLRQATVQVAQAARAVQVAERAREIAGRSRDMSRDAERMARTGFLLGRGTSLELVDAGRSLRDAEIQLALKEFDVVQAKIRALFALSSCTY
ncbi:MAG: TolC family protein [Polyangiaceae bacterium]|nr:TolC family protein [Polyangiaceae bacterium]